MLTTTELNSCRVCVHRRNAEIEAQIAQLRAALLHKEQEHDRMQLQLAQEKEEREKVQRKVSDAGCSSSPDLQKRRGVLVSRVFVVVISMAAEHKRLQGNVTGMLTHLRCIFENSNWCMRRMSTRKCSSR